MDTNFCQNGYWIPDWIQIFEMNRIPDWIQIFVKVDTGYRIGYEISLILVDTVSGTGYMYPDIPAFSQHSQPSCDHQIYKMEKKVVLDSAKNGFVF